ncbi:hypothetical protein GF385_02985 [Candidatus Dependentiae bacterium]|nr:hypothetical protein [Candidatus Dependentiae bacterium]
MKKILTILLLLTCIPSLFGINITLINDTNQPWKAKAESGGRYLTRYRRMRGKGRKCVFRNMPNQCTFQIVSQRRIGKGTARSGKMIVLRKDINSGRNLILRIKTCKTNDPNCQKIVSVKEESEEEPGRRGMHYYVE